MNEWRKVVIQRLKYIKKRKEEHEKTIKWKKRLFEENIETDRKNERKVV